MEIQKGLNLTEIQGTKTIYFELYSSDGYHFYDKTEEIYRTDDEGNFYLIPNEDATKEERTYFTRMIIPTSKSTSHFVSEVI